MRNKIILHYTKRVNINISACMLLPVLSLCSQANFVELYGIQCSSEDGEYDDEVR